jgi:hypothetical protein
LSSREKHWALATAAVAGLLAGLGCGGGRAEQAAGMKAGPFTEPGISSAEPHGSSTPRPAMSCTAAMKGKTP